MMSKRKTPEGKFTFFSIAVCANKDKDKLPDDPVSIVLHSLRK